MSGHLRSIATALLPILAAALVAHPARGAAQEAGAPPPAQAHWKGAIQAPGQTLGIEVDLARTTGDGWRGVVDIPLQGVSDRELSGVAVDGDSVTFGLPDVPGSPTFRGTVRAGGDSLAGTFRQGGQSFPFGLRRAGPSELAAGDGAPKGAAPEAAGDGSSDPLADFDAFVEKQMERWRVPGVAVAIVKDGRVIRSTAYGVRNRESGAPVTENTLFPIGSATKAFTSLAVGTQVEAGTLEWDRPVHRVLPWFRLQSDVAGRNATLRDLLSHRTGVPRHELLWLGADFSREEMIRRLAHLEASADFRTQFQYNNLMYVTAGHVAGRAAGTTWESLVRRRILGPLGMERTTFSIDSLVATEDHALGYRTAAASGDAAEDADERGAAADGSGDEGEREEELVRMDYRREPAMGPAGTLNSSAREMARWVRLHLDGGVVDGTRIVEASTIEETHEPVIVVDQGLSAAIMEQPETPYMMYGMGWFVQPYRGHPMIHHGGNIDGFTSLVSFMPEEELGIVVLANRNGTPLPTIVALRAYDRLLGLDPVDWATRMEGVRERQERAAERGEAVSGVNRKPDTETTHPLEDHVGRYRHPGYGTLEVRRDGEGGLEAIYYDLVFPLRHWHYDLFRGRAQDPLLRDQLEFEFQFETNRKGDIGSVAVDMWPGVEPAVFERRPPARMRDPAFLDRFTGEYELMGVTATVTRRDSSLVLTVPGQRPYELEPYRGTQFTLPEAQGYAVRFEMKGGAVAEMLLIQPTGIFRATPKEDGS